MPVLMQCVMYINLKKKKDVNEERKYVKESENTDRENDSQKKATFWLNSIIFGLHKIYFFSFVRMNIQQRYERENICIHIRV